MRALVTPWRASGSAAFVTAPHMAVARLLNARLKSPRAFFLAEYSELCPALRRVAASPAAGFQSSARSKPNTHASACAQRSPHASPKPAFSLR